MIKEENQSKNWNKFWQNPEITKSWAKKRIITILRSQVRKGEQALDAGCGSGFFSDFLAKNGLEVTALDSSETALKLCQKFCDDKKNIKYIKEDILSNYFSNNLKQNFDIVFSDGLLEHFNFNSQIKILKNFAKVLKPGGKIVTFVPNKFSPWQLIRPFILKGIYEEPMILKKLLFLNKTSGLKVIESGGINVLPVSFSPENLLGSYLGMILYTISSPEYI